MKVVVTGTRGIPHILGGVETHCEELFPRMADKDIDITIVRRTSYAKDNLSNYKGVHLVNISTPKKKAFEAIVHTVKAVFWAKKNKADILHIHAIGPALATPLARLLGMKVVFTHHGFDYDREKWGTMAKIMLRTGEKWGSKYANEVIVISNVINKHIKSKYKRTDAHLIYNGVPVPKRTEKTDYIESLGLQPKQYIFAMGRFVPEKNFHQLIEAFSLLDNTGNYRLVIAGDVDIEDAYSLNLKAKARENQVVLPGFIKGEKLQALLSHAHTFVLPSSHEGLPISLLEAMSYKLPVVVSDIDANKEIDLPADNYFKVGDIDALTEKLQSAIDLPPESPDYSMEQYNWDSIAKQTLEVYKGMGK